MEQAKAMLASWARSSVAGALAVYMTGNSNPKGFGIGIGRWPCASTSSMG